MLTKDKAEADKAKAALESGESWTSVAKKYSIDDTSKASGGKLPAQAKGTLDKELDDAVFSAKKNELVGPIKTQYGYYVFAVTGITDASPADAGRGQGDHQADAPVPEPAEGAGHLREGLHEALEGKDGVLRRLQDHATARTARRPRRPRRLPPGPDAAGPRPTRRRHDPAAGEAPAATPCRLISADPGAKRRLRAALRV